MIRLQTTGVFIAGFTLGCAAIAVAHDKTGMLPSRDPGSNAVLTEKLQSADGIEVILSDVVISPGAQVPRHYHPGEEFVYVIEGSAVHIEEGAEDRVYAAGEAFVIRKEKIHAPRAGAEGARAVVFRVHVEGEPERVLVGE